LWTARAPPTLTKHPPSSSARQLPVKIDGAADDQGHQQRVGEVDQCPAQVVHGVLFDGIGSHDRFGGEYYGQGGESIQQNQALTDQVFALPDNEAGIQFLFERGIFDAFGPVDNPADHLTAAQKGDQVTGQQYQGGYPGSLEKVHFAPS